jgi:hypothetical protein
LVFSDHRRLASHDGLKTGRNTRPKSAPASRRLCHAPGPLALHGYMVIFFSTRKKDVGQFLHRWDESRCQPVPNRGILRGTHTNAKSCLCASSRSAGVGVGARAGAGALYYSTCQWTRTILRGTRGPDERNRMVARALGHPVRAAGSLLLWREILRSPSSLFSFTVVSATNPLSVSRTHVMTYVASDFGEQRATIDDLIRE